MPGSLPVASFFLGGSQFEATTVSSRATHVPKTQDQEIRQSQKKNIGGGITPDRSLLATGTLPGESAGCVCYEKDEQKKNLEIKGR